MSTNKTPILLLKTKSMPNDSYEEYFSSSTSACTPIFIPVLEHRPNTANLRKVKDLLRDGELRRKYGGMIFTSQRAVEVFAQVVQELEGERMLEKGVPESSMTCPNQCPVVSFGLISTYFVIISLLHHVITPFAQSYF
jgi:Uroporphyrinogen-III synthase HemD